MIQSQLLRRGHKRLEGKWKPKAGVSVPRLKQAVDQGMLNDDEGLTLVEDMDESEDIPVPTEIQHVVPSAPQKSKEIP